MITDVSHPYFLRTGHINEPIDSYNKTYQFISDEKCDGIITVRRDQFEVIST